LLEFGIFSRRIYETTQHIGEPRFDFRTVVASFPMAYGQGDQEGALAVSKTIRTRASDLRLGFVSFGAGAGEYTLSGVPTGYGYETPPTGNLRYYDGTSDGVFDYFVDHGQDDPLTGGVYRADYFWQDPQWLFYPQAVCNDDSPIGCHGLSGIAYDPKTKSLWISGKQKGVIGNYSLTGDFLASFDAFDPAGYNAALAVDPDDHTLWMTTGGSGLLRQYSLDPATFGQLLQSGTPAELLFGGFESAEFQIVKCTPPTISALSAAPNMLRPPNHRMAPVRVRASTRVVAG
jgi:hypothetical protein